MRFSILTFSIIVFASLLHATEAKLWGEKGAWGIFIDPDNGYGCFAQRVFDDGLIVEIGAVPDRQGGFFAAYNEAWTQIEDGATGIVKFDFDDAKFAGDAVGVIKNDVPGGYAFFDNPEFVKEFGKRYEVTISGEEGTSVTIDLAGSSSAIKEVLACQSDQPVPEE